MSTATKSIKKLPKLASIRKILSTKMQRASKNLFIHSVLNILTLSALQIQTTNAAAKKSGNNSATIFTKINMRVGTARAARAMLLILNTLIMMASAQITKSHIRNWVKRITISAFQILKTRFVPRLNPTKWKLRRLSAKKSFSTCSKICRGARRRRSGHVCLDWCAC